MTATLSYEVQLRQDAIERRSLLGVALRQVEPQTEGDR